jgi:glycosyltransferase involved in cell wall biosynthesis
MGYNMTMAERNYGEVELSIVMPCLNEAETIGQCIKRARDLIDKYEIDGEILISDNGSTDGSRDIAKGLGARVIHCPVRGYGAALQFGIENAIGKYILMGDSDDSYHFDEAFPMIEKLRDGYDVCMGTRLKGKIMPDAMPWLNRHLGNPVLSAIGEMLFNINITDFHCGMRAFRRDKILSLSMVTTGMEWASEMVIKSKLAGLKITEVPITLYKDGRNRPPHLRRWRDGWRHLRFMLLHSPLWLFIIPGLIMLICGLAGGTILSRGVFQIGDIGLDIHSLIVMAFLVILGVQTIFTGIFARIYGHMVGVLPFSMRLQRIIKHFTLERLLIASVVIGIAGFIGFFYAMYEWYRVDFSALDYRVTMRILTPSLTLIAVAVQGVFNGFMLSVLFLRTKDKS